MAKFDHLFVQPRDFTKSLAFYTEILGWEIKSIDGEAQEANRLAYISNGPDFTMVLAEDHDKSPEKTPTNVYNLKGRISLHFATENVDGTFSKIKDGSHVVVRPENNHWGSRWFLVEDPDGNQFGWQGPIH